MARIRIPTSALDLLPFCQTSQDRHPEVLFQSYAALMTTAAAYGFHLVGRKAPEVTKFLTSPEPIDLGIFRSQDLYSQLLLLSLGCADEMEGDTPLEEEYLSKLVENLAGTGLKALSARLASAGGPSSFVYALGAEQRAALTLTI